MKNRVQTFGEFYACLQREFIVAEMRSRIYLKEKDIKYYKEKEMVGKRASIEAIAARNNFPSIFTDDFLMAKYRSEIINEWGLPNFIYRSDDDRQRRRKSDVISYFHKGVKVNVKGDSGVCTGYIVWTDYETSTADVNVKGEVFQVTFDNLQRVF